MLTLNEQGRRTSPEWCATDPGRQVIRLSVGHLQLASNPAITRATMAVSFDGGKTWHTAKVSPAGKPGQFAAAFPAPAKAFVTLRVTATDKAGGLDRRDHHQRLQDLLTSSPWRYADEIA